MSMMKKKMIYSVASVHSYMLKSGELNTKLISLYANNQCFLEAERLLPSPPDIFSFTTIIYAASKFNNSHYTLHLFSRMRSFNLLPDAQLLPCAIKACASLMCLRIALQIHGHITTSGSLAEAFVQSSLFHFYLKVGMLDNARKLFDEMPDKDVKSCSALAAGYAKKADKSNARQVFCKMRESGVEPNVVSWNGMIAGFNQSGQFLEAVLMFKDMHLSGLIADGIGISSVLPSIGHFVGLSMGAQVHGYVVKIGLLTDKCVHSAFIDMYGKCHCCKEMLTIFEDLDHVDVGACNALISGLSRSGLVNEALGTFEKFQSLAVELNVVSWTSMIACCSQHGKDMEALELFREMQKAGVKPNSVTIPCLLPACGNIAALSHGKAAHCYSIRQRFWNDVYVGSALVDMYANCGRIQKARHFFNMMSEPNLVCWNALLSGYAMHGMAKEATEIFHLMQIRGVKPDSVTFTSLLSACSQSGLVNEGRLYFDSMLQSHGIEPRMEQYACMVSLLGRAGKLEEAYSLITSMPLEPDACVWGALLSSCRVHHNMNLGEIAAYKLFELEPNNPGNYILLSNIYASRGKWKEVDNVRDIMKSRGLRKNPGCSWIEFKNKVHMLLAGDQSHPQMSLILEKLDDLRVEMKRSGFAPNTHFVLQDVEEQEKEHILCGHSEKLAVVFGMLNTKAGSSLNVIKNLRICGDCHNFMKFISISEGREIYVRDTNRFHHFKDGICSCGDYW
ncbi:hypothetical protein LIER_41924 [Lithospermum erythrorhizon]|uniref:DYW domain-containing protein n=1 Tax=Lithospermum erythrorhizon TaxID=34254 RepID=A0AAV3RGV7_LITER